MIETLVFAASLFCVEPAVPSAAEVESVLETGWQSESVYGTTAPYDFLTEPQPSEDDTLSYRIYVDPLYEPYTACFDEIVTDVLADPRGWGNMRRAGPTENPQMWIILTPPGVARCGDDSTPYGSCGWRDGYGHGHVYINAGRWMAGYSPWRTLEDSRAYLVNHEVGHILNLEHMDCTVMGYNPIHPDVEGGHTEDVEWDTCIPPTWPTRMISGPRL